MDLREEGLTEVNMIGEEWVSNIKAYGYTGRSGRDGKFTCFYRGDTWEIVGAMASFDGGNTDSYYLIGR